MTATRHNKDSKRVGLAVLGAALACAALTAALPQAVSADSRSQQSDQSRAVESNTHDAQSRERDRQNFLRSQQRQSLRNLQAQQTLAHDQQISRANDARNRQHDAQSRERDRQNFLRSQHKRHVH